MATAMGIEELFQQGFQARCNGQYGEARLYLQRVLQMDPAHMKALHQLGLIQGFEGDFDASLDTLGGLSKKYPTNTDILYDLAMTQMMLGMSDEACANLRKILTLDPKHENAIRQSDYCA
jgi:tetratricopeptide (TPR) repeat protein